MDIPDVEFREYEEREVILKAAHGGKIGEYIKNISWIKYSTWVEETLKDTDEETRKVKKRQVTTLYPLPGDVHEEEKDVLWITRTPWQETSTINPEGAKLSGKRTIITRVPKNIKDDVEEKVLIWFKRVYEAKTWEQAKANCASINGRLFDDLNGTKAQLEFLARGAQQRYYFLGIRSVSDDVYENLDEQEIENSLLIWANAKDSSLPNYSNVVALGTYDNVYRYLHLYPDNYNESSICDMRGSS